MRRRWVCDASPLILLAKVGRADWLPTLATELLVPAAVAEEIEAGLPDDPARHWLGDRKKELVHTTGEVAPEVMAWDLGLGERAVLSWALRHQNWTALLASV